MRGEKEWQKVMKTEQKLKEIVDEIEGLFNSHEREAAENNFIENLAPRIRKTIKETEKSLNEWMAIFKDK